MRVSPDVRLSSGQAGPVSTKLRRKLTKLDEGRRFLVHFHGHFSSYRLIVLSSALPEIILVIEG